MGPAVDEKQWQTDLDYIEVAQREGARLVTGGKRPAHLEHGYFVEPTIFDDVTPGMRIFKEEVFGPVICINSYSTISEAISLANDTKFGLQCGVFTNSVSELNQCFNEIEVGGVIHNHTPILRFDHMPYGGVKESGLGREGVKYAMHDMLEPKVLVK